MGNKEREKKKKQNIFLLESANNISDSAWIKNIQSRNNKWVTMKGPCPTLLSTSLKLQILQLCQFCAYKENFLISILS